MGKLIGATPITYSEWQEVRLPIGILEEIEVLRALSFSTVPVRCLDISHGYANIRILAVSQDFPALERELQQALTDQQLRKEINQRSNPKINEIIEAVIAKVTGH